MESSITRSINAPAEVVWQVMSDVEAWPDWTRSVSSVELLEEGPLRLGSRARIQQPRLPTVVWTVTEFAAGRSFTWTSQGPGSLGVATHSINGDNPCGVTLRLQQTGLLGGPVARLYKRLTFQYLTLEIEGLSRASIERAG